MSKPNASRRAFLTRGALLAVPLVAAAAPAMALADAGANTRLARLQDEAAIRQLHQSWLRRLHAGERVGLLEPSVRLISAHPGGATDRIEVAQDGQRASGHYDCAVERDSTLPQDCTLAQMAHAQGHGTVRRTEHRGLLVEYAKSAGAWQIAGIKWRAL